jgi:hypothetical protein
MLLDDEMTWVLEGRTYCDVVADKGCCDESSNTDDDRNKPKTENNS